MATSKRAVKKTSAKKTVAKRPAAKKAAPRVKLLSGDNPQIAKGFGEAPVRAYLAAVPGWKRDVAKRIDALITRAVPKVEKAVKWNTPLYGLGESTWFAAMHCYTHFVRVTFFAGRSLDPMPAGASKTPRTRYHDVREDAPLDERQFVAWIKAASQLPGERM